MWPFKKDQAASYDGKSLAVWLSKLKKAKSEPEAKKISNIFGRHLAKADPVQTSNVLVETLVRGSSSKLARRHAAIALANAMQNGHIDPSKSELIVEGFHQVLKDDDAADIHSAVLTGIAELGEAGIPLLSTMQGAYKKADKPKVIERLCKCLGMLGPAAKSAIPLILETLQTHEEWEVRAAAAEALGDIRSPTKDVVVALKDAMQDDSGDVQQNAQEAIQKLREAKE